MPGQGVVFLKDLSGNTASIDTSGNLKINVAIGSITSTINVSGQNVTLATSQIITGSGVVVPATSGGVALSTSLASTAITIAYTGSGRLFVGNAPVASGTTDAQRVGFPLFTVSGSNVGGTARLTISNAANLKVAAETSGQTVFYMIEAP